LFADSIGEIHVSGGVVRIDLVSASVSERDANNKPKLEFRRRVVMPVEGFAQSFGLMLQVMQSREKKGLVRRADADDRAGKGSAAPPQPSSPNFK
jgi:hypothetical protein